VIQHELEALLAVQVQDGRIREVEDRREAMKPELELLDATLRQAEQAVARSETTFAREEEKSRALDARITEHRALHERNVERLNNAEKLHDAAAAAAQVEAARRALADEESEALALSRRLGDLRTALNAHREHLDQLQCEQTAERARHMANASTIEAELSVLRADRAETARQVSPAMLGKYERIAGRRRGDALIAVRDFCCSACDTAIPLQRRPAMASGNVIEPCEGCGVLLYATT
jgi:uncharacterized protein